MFRPGIADMRESVVLAMHDNEYTPPRPRAPPYPSPPGSDPKSDTSKEKTNLYAALTSNKVKRFAAVYICHVGIGASF